MISSILKRTYDVVVIGGGVTGIGVAFEAAKRGLKVCLLEKNSSLAQETSANSLRIIHSGFRYIQNFDIVRVLESIQASEHLKNTYPNFLIPLPCVMPFNQGLIKNTFTLKCAIKFYDTLRSFLGYAPSEYCVNTNQETLSPLLNNKNAAFFLQWHDLLLVNHESFIAFLSKTLSQKGVNVIVNAKVVEIKDYEGGLYCTDYKLRENHKDTYQEVSYSVISKFVVNCSGPLVQTNRSLIDQGKGIYENILNIPEFKKKSIWCKAFNIVFSEQLEKKFAVGAASPEGRLLFIVPREKGSVLGTEYIPIHDNEVGTAKVTEEEISHFMQDFNKTFPSVMLTTSQITAVDVGYLPVKKIVHVSQNPSHSTTSEKRPKVKLYGKEIIISEGGYYKVLSTKYTTFFEVGKKVMNRIEKQL
jgi:glycerol-3-phosphate dehydrogenase